GARVPAAREPDGEALAEGDDGSKVGDQRATSQFEAVAPGKPGGAHPVGQDLVTGPGDPVRIQTESGCRREKPDAPVAGQVQREPAERRANSPLDPVGLERYPQRFEGRDLVGEGPEPIVLKLEQLGLPEAVILDEGAVTVPIGPDQGEGRSHG